MSRHAIDRAAERYGLSLGYSDIANLRALVKPDDPRAVLLGAYSSDGAKLWALRFYREGMRPLWLLAVVNRESIATFLDPADMPVHVKIRLSRRVRELAKLGLEPKPKKPRSQAAKAKLRQDRDAAFDHYCKIRDLYKGG
jgi:hypothetical protein